MGFIIIWLEREEGLMRVEETIKLQKTKYSSSWFCEQREEDHHCLTCRDSDCRDIGMKHGWCVWWRSWLTDAWICLCLYGLIQKLDATLSVFSVSSHSLFILFSNEFFCHSDQFPYFFMILFWSSPGHGLTTILFGDGKHFSERMVRKWVTFWDNFSSMEN